MDRNCMYPTIAPADFRCFAGLCTQRTGNMAVNSNSQHSSWTHVLHYSKDGQLALLHFTFKVGDYKIIDSTGARLP
jgi:hypothetical protein